MAFEKIHGNEFVKELICSEIAMSRLSHAFIIEGPEKSGKTLECQIFRCILIAESRECFTAIH